MKFIQGKCWGKKFMWLNNSPSSLPSHNFSNGASLRRRTNFSRMCQHVQFWGLRGQSIAEMVWGQSELPWSSSARLPAGSPWCSGESTRLPPMWPGFDSQTRCHMWVEFVGSLLCTERFFSGYFGFHLSSKTNIWLDLRSLLISVYSDPNRPIRLTQCCTQFKSFGNKAFCSKYFHII